MRNLGPRPQTSTPPPLQRRAGFTLIEAALTTVIIGTGVLAIVSAQQAYHQKNQWATKTGTAMLLANEVRELTLSLPHHDPLTGTLNFGPESGEGLVDITGEDGQLLTYDDLDDFAGPIGGDGRGAGVTFNPPINALGRTVEDLGQWTQQVRVDSVLPDHINAPLSQPLGTTDLMRVTVTVRFQGPQDEQPWDVTSLTWVVTK